MCAPPLCPSLWCMAADSSSSTPTRRTRSPHEDGSSRFSRRRSHGAPKRGRLSRATRKAQRQSTSTELVPYEQSEPAGPQPRTGISNKLTQLYWNASMAMHRFQNRPPKTRTAKIVVVVPAHNEEDTIAGALQALLAQTRRPDRIVVVADNCTDNTVEIARRFGRRVTVIETVGNRDRKVGALRMAWQQYVAYGYDYMLGVDADTVLSPDSLAAMERRAGGEPEGRRRDGPLHVRPRPRAVEVRARLLVRLQRLEFAAWTIDILHRKRNTYVLGGQATLFRVKRAAGGRRRASAAVAVGPGGAGRGHGADVGAERARLGDKVSSQRARLRRPDADAQVAVGAAAQVGRGHDPAAARLQDRRRDDVPVARCSQDRPSTRSPAACSSSCSTDLARGRRVRLELDLGRPPDPRRACSTSSTPARSPTTRRLDLVLAGTLVLRRDLPLVPPARVGRPPGRPSSRASAATAGPASTRPRACPPGQTMIATGEVV